MASDNSSRGPGRRKAWTPPPMNDQAAGEQAAPKVRLDEKVVRRMLRVNPTLRAGRTTLQVKRALEEGESITAQATKPAQEPGAQRRAQGGTHDNPTAKGARGELEGALDFFVRSKEQALHGQLAELAERRKQIEAEEQQLRSQMVGELAGFLAMLDAEVVGQFGAAVLAKHSKLLEVLGSSAAALLDQAQRKRGKA